MKQTFKSKIGIEVILLIAGIFAIVLSVGFVGGIGWSMLGILSPVIVFMIPVLFATSYTIHDHNLVIRSVFFLYRKINIHQISKIRSSRSWRSAPAISVDRLELFYSKYDSVLISPKDKQQFIHELLKIAPDIAVDLKTP